MPPQAALGNQLTTPTERPAPSSPSCLSPRLQPGWLKAWFASGWLEAVAAVAWSRPTLDVRVAGAPDP